MKIPKFVNVKTRKEHICIGCNKPIEKGSVCQFMTFRAPKMIEDDIQVGIEYVKMWLHDDSVGCWQDKEAEGNKNIDNHLYSEYYENHYKDFQP